MISRGAPPLWLEIAELVTCILHFRIFRLRENLALIASSGIEMARVVLCGLVLVCLVITVTGKCSIAGEPNLNSL